MKQREIEINKFSEERIKIVESGGVKVEELLTKKNPFKKKNAKKNGVPFVKIQKKVK